MASASVVFEIVAKDNASNKFAAVGRSADGTSSKMSKLGGAFKTMGKFAAVGVAAAAAGAVVLGKKLLDAGERAGTSNARINQIATSMKVFGGETDNVTKRLVKLAEKTALQTGMDQNAIKATQAKFLTFKQLATSADDVGGAFDRATKVAVDMEAAGFGPAQQTAVQLGKALQDPIKGITALNRSGITFTKNEKAKIAALVEGGKHAKAQSVILKAMESQVGGTAKATANGTDRLKVALSQVTEHVGLKLVPVVDKLATWFVGKAMPAMKSFGDYLHQVLPPVFDRIRGVIASFTGDGSGKLSAFVAGVKGVFRDGIQIVTVLWNTFGKTITSYLRGSLKNAMTVLRGAFKVIQGIFQVVSGILTGDWKKTWRGIKNILSGVKTALVGIVKQLWNLISTVFKIGGTAVKSIFKGLWTAVKTLARTGAAAVVSAIQALPGKIVAVGGKMLAAGKTLMSKVFEGIKSAAKGAGGVVAAIGTAAWGAIRGMINSAISAMNAAIPNSIGAGKLSINIPDNPIPHLAKGGIVTKPTLALIGEDGPEAVVPLGAKHRLQHPVGVGGGDTHLHVHVHGNLVDPIGTVRALEKATKQYIRATGRPLQVQTL